MMKIVAVAIVVLLLILSNLYLLRSGFWFYKDAGYWPKNVFEVYLLVIQQFQAFTNTGYYLGFDQGLLSFTRILYVSWIAVLFGLFGYVGSQVTYSISGLLLVFFSFYLFSRIIFTDKKTRFVLTLLYTFNPLAYSLQGATFYNAAIPLFLYSYHQFFYTNKTRFWFLFVNIIAGFMWVAYIRFFALDMIVIAPFIIYFFFQYKKKLAYKKVLIYITSYALIFSPMIYSFGMQLVQRSATAFNYASVLGRFVAKDYSYNGFNIFQSSGASLYNGSVWSVVGLLFFIFFLLLYLTGQLKEKRGLQFLCMGIILFAIFAFSIGNIFDPQIYFFFLKLLPFVTNAPFWGLYILLFPFTILLGIITLNRQKILFWYVGLFIVCAVMPLLNLRDFQLQKYDLRTIPQPYYDYTIKPYSGLPEATYYSFGVCWRARYMEEAGVPTLCPNWGLQYSTAFLADPRLTSGKTYDIAKTENGYTDTDNFRVTHNLKNIIIPNDVVSPHGPGPITSVREIRQIEASKKVFDVNPSLGKLRNDNFTHYYYKDKDDYDFLLYIPQSVYYQNDTRLLYENSLKLADVPVILDKETMVGSRSAQRGTLSYKASPTNPTKYVIKISDIDTAEPLLLQLNQTFSPSWRVVFVDKSQFEKYACITMLSRFIFTHSLRCQYGENLLDLGDLSLLGKDSVSNDQHMTGNYVSNAWLISPDILKKHAVDTSLYAVIIYTKQIYYSVTILISFITLLILLVLSIIQEAKRLRRTSKA